MKYNTVVYGCLLFLLLLHSPAISLRFTILGEIVAYVAVFYPTIEVVTFRLCGCLGVMDEILKACNTVVYGCDR